MRRKLRRSYEAGHNPKLLVLVDEMEDCGKAVYYASRRATRIGGKIVLLRVILVAKVGRRRHIGGYANTAICRDNTRPGFDSTA